MLASRTRRTPPTPDDASRMQYSHKTRATSPGPGPIVTVLRVTALPLLLIYLLLLLVLLLLLYLLCCIIYAFNTCNPRLRATRVSVGRAEPSPPGGVCVCSL